jgi:hypothetical protein
VWGWWLLWGGCGGVGLGGVAEGSRLSGRDVLARMGGRLRWVWERSKGIIYGVRGEGGAVGDLLG